MPEKEIDFDAIPGTSHLVDLKREALPGEIVNDKGIILIPTPSDDPNDPLNWSRTRKWVQMFCVILYCYGGGIPGCCIYSIIRPIADDPSVNISVAQLNQGTGFSFLFLGIGNLFWLPIAQQWGKRPVYILSMILLLGFNLWLPFFHQSGEWLASKILHGFCYAPIETLPAITVSDLFFEHDRATWMGVYGVALYTSNYIAPMFAGLVNDAIGWKWTIGISLVFGLVCAILMALLMEETNYNRKLRVVRNAEGGIVKTLTARPNNEKSPASVETVPKKTSDSSDSEEIVANALTNQASVIDASQDVVYPPVKTFWQRMSFVSGFQKKNFIWQYFFMPFKMAQYPVVLYSGFLYGSSLFFYSILNTTESIVLGGEPYNWSPASCGLAYASAVVFVFICYPLAGWSSDWIKIYFAKKHNGVSHAEDRLWVLLVYMILGPASLILWGVGAAHHVMWFGVVVGLGLMAGLCVVGCVSSVTYVIDCYPEMNVSCMTVVILIRNSMNFAIDYGITPFVDNVGLQNTFIACCFICFFCIGTFLVMEFTGHYWRNRHKARYWNMVAGYRRSGILG